MNDGDNLHEEGEPHEWHGVGSGSDSPNMRAFVAGGVRSYRHTDGNAELKIRRAKEHFSTFRVELQQYYDGVPWRIRPIRDGADLALVIESHEPVPDSLALIAGDLLYNARSALDCAVMDIASLGRGSFGRPPESDREERSLSFPIGDSALSADKRAALARFLPAETVAALTLVQPIEVARGVLEERRGGPVADDLVATRCTRTCCSGCTP